MSQRIRGVLAPVVTPFKADLSPDSLRFIAHCKWLLSQNCGLAVFGTNSEANSLSMEERAMLLDELVAAEVDPSRMLPGTGCCSIMETVKLTITTAAHKGRTRQCINLRGKIPRKPLRQNQTEFCRHPLTQPR
jgi:4-hydroxy-tetrahydrodipicolinate synthase